MAKSGFNGCPNVAEVYLGTRGHSLQEFGQDYSVTDHTCPFDAQSSNSAEHTGDLELQNALGVRAVGRRPRDLMDPDSMIREQLTSTATKQVLLNEEVQILAMKTHLEVQQREDIPRDLAERMKFVPPCLRVGQQGVSLARGSEHNSARLKIWKRLKVEIIIVKVLMIGDQYWYLDFQVNTSKLRRPSDTVDLEESPDSCERAGAPVLWLSCDGPLDGWKLFSNIPI